MPQTDPSVARTPGRPRHRAALQPLFLLAVAATLVCGCQSSSAPTPSHPTTAQATSTAASTTARAASTSPSTTATAGTTTPPVARTTPAAVVQRYVDAINAHDYATAWRLGGSNLGSTYGAFAAGFADTLRDTLTILHVHRDTVRVRLVARQTGGRRTTYEGTYTVQHGKIVAANVHRVGSSSTPSASVGHCAASVKFPRPGDGGSETVYVTSNVPRSPVTATMHYNTKDSPYQSVTSSSGSASITFDIGRPTRDYTVAVDVAIDGKASCSTSFTPH
jgi:hypothetical protein